MSSTAADSVDDVYHTIAALATLHRSVAPPAKASRRKKQSEKTTNGEKSRILLRSASTVSAPASGTLEEKGKKRLVRRKSEISALGVDQGGREVVVEPASDKPHKHEGGIKTMWKKFAKKATRKTPDRGASSSPQDAGSLPILSNNLADDQPLNSEEPATREAKADPVYNLLKGASMLRKVGEGDNSSGVRNLTRQNTSSSGRSSRSSSPAYATARPRQMLNRRMKSFSLDTPDAPKQVDQSTKMKSSSYTNNTCIPGGGLSPAAARRRNLMSSQRRGLSVDIEDQEGQSSYNNSNSSVHTSHSNSPHYARRNHQSEGYIVGDSVVALFDVEGVEPGDISFKAGDKVVLTDIGDPEWWAGMCQGYTGYFPSRYVLTVAKGQSLYKVIKPVHLSDSDFRLLRDQVVVDEGGGDANSMNIYTKDVKTGRAYQLKCPRRYLERLTNFI